MSLVIPDVGEVEMLKRILNNSATGNVVLKLYSNDPTINDNLVLGGLTECAITGYSKIALAGASWTISTVAGVSSADYAQQTFTLTGSGVVNGYYIVNSGENVLMWAERFSGAPYNLPQDGGSVKVTPHFELA